MKGFLPVFVYLTLILCYFMESAMALQRYYMEESCKSIIDMAEDDIPAGRLSVTKRSKYRNRLNCQLTIDYMEESCKSIIDMAEDDIPAGRLSVTKRSKYRNRLNCQLTILAPPDMRLLIVFRDLDIEWEHTCDDDFVQLFDGESLHAPMVQGLDHRLCGYKTPPDSYVTTGNALTVFFQSDIYKQDNGFEIVFTAFHTSDQGCYNDEFRCDNGRCIASLLECNNFDNCGDDSDECHVSAEVLMSVILSVFLLTVVGVGAIAIYKKKKKLAKFSKAVEKKSMPKIKCNGCGKALQTKTPNLPRRATRKWRPLMAGNSPDVWTTDTEAPAAPYQPLPLKSDAREATLVYPEKCSHHAAKRASV